MTACSGSSDGGGAATSPASAPATSSAATPLTSSSTPPPAAAKVLWPAPSNPLALTRKAGLVPERAEILVHHVHSHLDVFVNGTPVVVASGIGINIADPAVHRFPNPDGSIGYGGVHPPCAQVCISPLHTHDIDGVLHTESKSVTPNRLGQFFTEWGVRLTPTCVGQFCTPATSIAIYVNGKAFRADPRSIQLNDHTEIAVVIGTAPAVIPSVAPVSE
jgi:hypothetical protein